MEKIIADIREYAKSRWIFGELHGIAHWDRVYENGLMLITPEVNKTVVGLFAYLHDSCRYDDSEDIDHGARASEWLNSLRDSLLRSLNDDEFNLLKEACRLHTIAHKTGNPTIDACFDADRLGLWRCGIIPDPKRMATEKGKYIAATTNYESLTGIKYTFKQRMYLSLRRLKYKSTLYP
ncbi:MAG: hypothetical protein J6S96_07900 [Muribaculaceae bacterium]|nr:hypothetical protein [Muribaculaceae bacterium]